MAGGNWYDEVFFDDVRLGAKVDKTVFSDRSEFQKVEIFDTPRFGRVMALDETFMTSELDEFIYHEMLTHPALTTAKSIDRVLVIGGGDGGTVREVLKHDVKKVVMIEIDKMVVDACKEHLTTIGSAWDDPRLDVRFDDGIKYVKESDEEKYDVIFIDGTDPVGPGAVLFTEDFFRGAKRMLREDGIMALQSETPIFLPDVFVEAQKTLQRTFKHVFPYFAPVPLYASGSWSWTWCSDQDSHLAPDEKRQARIEETSKYYNRDIHKAAFCQPQYVKRKLGG